MNKVDPLKLKLADLQLRYNSLHSNFETINQQLIAAKLMVEQLAMDKQEWKSMAHSLLLALELEKMKNEQNRK